ncbi:DddA-like double-stranded DNA deaminase toxin [Micromonospora sp. NPDC092111]|uniref:DddA-like double-stranded DNA deaminase toxin n=1 Tax=Micromonospora sp. NPDC092111 TaxID=3364289 RepID=UPI00382490C7
MRRTGTVQADLAIDNTICGTNDRDQTYPWTCDKILPAILPQGCRLRVRCFYSCQVVLVAGWAPFRVRKSCRLM